MFYFKVFWLSEVKQQNKLIEFKETMPCLLKQTNKKKNKKETPQTLCIGNEKPKMK